MRIIFNHSHLSRLVEDLGRRLGNLKPAFERIRTEVLEPLIAPAWAASGIESRSGKLRRAILPWHKSRSSGVKLNARRSNTDLTLAKADVLQKGRRKRRHLKRAKYQVKNRRGTTFERRNLGSPWGDIRPRVFMPQRRAVMAKKAQIERILAQQLREGR